MERRLQGQIDTPLNETGELQAKAAGQALRSLRFDKAYSSDLKRAKNTCAFILDANVKSSITSKDINGKTNYYILKNQFLFEFEFRIARSQREKLWSHGKQIGE